MRQLPLDVRVVAPASLDNFVAGPNAELVALLRAISGGQRPAKCLLVWGEAGSGKSHLLQALASAAAADAGLALLDDAQRLDARGQARWFARFIEQAGDPAAMIVASADAAPMHLHLREDLRTRLGSGLVVQLRRLNDEEKALALRQHAAARQINLPDELLRHLLRHYPRDIRTLTGLLDNLDRFAFEHRRALSLPLLRDMEAAGQDPETGPGGPAEPADGRG